MNKCRYTLLHGELFALARTRPLRLRLFTVKSPLFSPYSSSDPPLFLRRFQVSSHPRITLNTKLSPTSPTPRGRSLKTYQKPSRRCDDGGGGKTSETLYERQPPLCREAEARRPRRRYTRGLAVRT